MIRLHEVHPEYDWAINKGYPTEDHRAAIERIGISAHHRKTFRLIPEKPLLFEP